MLAMCCRGRGHGPAVLAKVRRLGTSLNRGVHSATYLEGSCNPRHPTSMNQHEPFVHPWHDMRPATRGNSSCRNSPFLHCCPHPLIPALALPANTHARTHHLPPPSCPRRYVAKNQGQQFTENPPSALGDIYADSTPATPIIFILSQGADPTSSLSRCVPCWLGCCSI